MTGFDLPPAFLSKMLAIFFICVIFLAAAMFALELRVSRLNDRLRNVERALSSMNKKYND